MMIVDNYLNELKRIKTVFIISTGRTGTKFFANYFQNKKPFNGFGVYHEAKPYMQQDCYNFIKRLVDKKEFVNIFLKKRHALMKNSKIYLESNPDFGFTIPVLRELFPESVIIHIIRNPIDYIKSVANRIIYVNGKLVQKYSIDRGWDITADDFKKNRYFGKWRNMDMYERIAWMWDFRNRLYLKYIKDDRNSLTVRFEDIFRNKERPGIKAINEILTKKIDSRLKIDKYDKMFSRKINTNKKIIDNNFDLNYINKNIFCKSIIASLSNKFGYSI